MKPKNVRNKVRGSNLDWKTGVVGLCDPSLVGGIGGYTYANVKFAKIGISELVELKNANVEAKFCCNTLVYMYLFDLSNYAAWKQYKV